MAANQTATLPNEIWIRVLQNLDNDEEICDLWTTCRHVCTAFRDATESIFRERHLPKTRFHFDLGEEAPLPLNPAYNGTRKIHIKSKWSTSP
jgi:DNA-binding XRE family transcriptional regulator